MKFHFNGIQFELEEFSQLFFLKIRTSLRRWKIHGWELWGINRINREALISGQIGYPIYRNRSRF